MADEQQADRRFFDHADAFIKVANDQCDDTDRREVTASMMFASARFNAFVAAVGFKTGDEMRQQRDEILEFYASRYRMMLQDCLDEYIANHAKYIRAPR